MTPPYDVDHFIRKFEAIPEELWNEKGDYQDPINPECKCAFGHLGFVNGIINKDTEEVIAFRRLSDFRMTKVNDGEHSGYQQPTPKQRILAALRDIKDREK